DLPAPLWPTRPTHSLVSTARSTPSSARTAPKCFSTPSSLTMLLPASAITGSVPTVSDDGEADECAQSRLHVGRDRLFGIVLGVLMAGDATLLDVGKGRLEVVLREGEIRHQEVVRDVLVAVEDLLRHPEGEGGDAGGDRGRPGGIAILRLLLLPPLQFVLAIAHDDGRPRLAAGGKGLRRAVAVAALVDDAGDVGERG